MNEPSRRLFLQSAAALTGAAWFPLKAKGQRRRPNVLLLSADGLRTDHVGLFGERPVLTPNLDRLAADGLAFRHGYCPQAVCGPSRASLMTGCRPDTNRIWGNNVLVKDTCPEAVTLPQQFRTHGYTTLSRGAIYGSKADDPTGWSEPPTGATGPWIGRGYRNPDSIAMVRALEAEEGVKEAGGRGPSFEAADVPDEGYADGVLAAQAIDDLNRLRHEPFFLAVGFGKPHLPFNAPQRYWDLYRREEIPLPSNPYPPEDVPPLAMHLFGELRRYPDIPDEGPLSDEMTVALNHGYRACVSYMDAQLGKVLDELDRLNLAEQTIVIFWADHGCHLGDHGLWAKHSNFETAARIPLIVRAPGQPRKGVITPALGEIVDLYPTLCELTGLPTPATLEGASLVPLLSEPEPPWKKAAFFQYPRGNRMGYSVRTERYRYTRWQEKSGELFARELYDHQTDPDENHNVAAHPDQATTIAELDALHAAGWRGARPG